MDFLEFLKSSCYYSDVKFDMRDNMIYKWQTSEYTGFSLYKLNDYEIRVDYCGSATDYTLQHYSSDYQIYKGGSHTNYVLRDNGYGDLQLYYGGSLYGQGDYMKEQEKKKEETAPPTKSSSDSGGLFSDGFWSWKSWGCGWLMVFLLGWLFPFVPIFILFMIIWAILLIIHSIKKR